MQLLSCWARRVLRANGPVSERSRWELSCRATEQCRFAGKRRDRAFSQTKSSAVIRMLRSFFVCLFAYFVQLKTLTRALMSSLSFACGSAAMPPNGIWAMSFQEGCLQHEECPRDRRDEGKAGCAMGCHLRCVRRQGRAREDRQLQGRLRHAALLL